MNLADSLDLYCERTGPDLFSEPVNFATNLAFLVGAFAAFRVARASGLRRLPKSVSALILLMAITGLGSAVFHSFGTEWARIVDVVPIALYVLVCMGAILRCFDHGLWFVVMGYVAFGLLSVAFISLVPESFGSGSRGYFSTFVSLSIAAVALFRRNRDAGGFLLLAAGCFLSALFFRSIDLVVCARWPLGTHFLWHILNGFVLYFATRSVITLELQRQDRIR